MSKIYKIECSGHNSIYMDNYLEDNYNKRKFNVYFNIPELGVNSETGLLLFIAGFGGNTNSNVYKKVRDKFADEYNLVTIQCDYFGWEFMQQHIEMSNLRDKHVKNLETAISEQEFKRIFDNEIVNLQELLKLDLKESKRVILEQQYNEEINNFNDMGLMQALDNITAILTVMSILFNNNYVFNTKKIIIMGQSHGAYIAYLCNRMCEGLFTYILDNSAWIYPNNLKRNRILPFKNGNLDIDIEISYLAKRLNLNFDFLNLKNLYENFNNQCKIVVYHGEGDKLITLKNKSNALKSIDNVYLNEIFEKDLDMDIFKSTSHGLGADFIKLFHKFYSEYVTHEIYDELDFKNQVEIKYSEGKVVIDYSKGVPYLYIYGD